jgi:hypothetical protein
MRQFWLLRVVVRVLHILTEELHVFLGSVRVLGLALAQFVLDLLMLVLEFHKGDLVLLLVCNVLGIACSVSLGFLLPEQDGGESGRLEFTGCVAAFTFLLRLGAILGDG